MKNVEYTVPKKLLSGGKTNSKTAKNLRETLILYLAPAKQNLLGVNLCAMASKGCAKSCLFTAGHGVFSNVREARMNRTHYYLINRHSFLNQLAREIRRKALRLQKSNESLVVRLNGTSDVPLVEQLLHKHALDIPENVIFYDYTKYPKKAGNQKNFTSGHRYEVAFSLSEGNLDTFLWLVQNKLAVGAAVFNVPKSKDLPTEWKGMPVVDGDSRDDLMLDVPRGTILGLRAKGKAITDDSGFVIKL